MKAKLSARVEPVPGGGHFVLVPVDAADKAQLDHRARVRGTIDGVAYRSSLMKYSGRFHMGVHKATLAKAGKNAGDTVDVVLERDDEPLPEDTVPDELVAAMKKDAALRAAWEKLAPSHRREHVKHINAAKKAETRAARVEKTLTTLRTLQR